MGYLEQNGVLYLWNKIKAKFVMKEAGKGLSTKDFTAEEKAKLAGIATGAEANAQTDWNVSDVASDAFLKNKPTSLPANGGNADTVGGKKVLKDVPVDAVFTDTIYTHPASHPASMITGLPTSLPANGGNAATVGGHTVGTNVPADAVFTDTTYAKATTAADGLMPKEDAAKLAAFQAASNYALKADIVDMYKYKGSVTNEAALPKSGQSAGDVYNIQAASIYGGPGANVAWDGSAWDALGEIFTITAITNAELDSICV